MSPALVQALSALTSEWQRTSQLEQAIGCKQLKRTTLIERLHALRCRGLVEMRFAASANRGRVREWRLRG